MAAAEESRSAYFEDLYRLVCDREATLEEKIERAIDVERDRLGVEYGVVTYTGDGDYEILDTNISTGTYTPGSVTDLDTTWCRHVVSDREMLAFGDADETAYADDVAKEATGLYCYIGAPLIVDGEAYGTVCYSSEASQLGFTDDVPDRGVPGARAAGPGCRQAFASLSLDDRQGGLGKHLDRRGDDRHRDRRDDLRPRGSTAPALREPVPERGRTQSTRRFRAGHDWRGSVESDENGTRFVFTGVETRSQRPVGDAEVPVADRNFVA